MGRRTYYFEHEGPSTFVRADRCIHCNDGIMMQACPNHWPVDTVALMCYACGRVLRYLDNLLLMAPREAMIEFVTRQFATRRSSRQSHAVSVDTTRGAVSREAVLKGLELGVPDWQIASDLHCTRDYVEAIARNAGFATERLGA